MSDERRDRWEESYARGENFVFEAKDEFIRFLSRHVRKRTDLRGFQDVLKPSEGKTRLRALDYGCGIGSQALFLAKKFDIDAVGVDVSTEAIKFARKLEADTESDFEASCVFQVLDGTQCVPVDDLAFDISVCDAVLDSMTFDLARESMSELARVTKRYIFFSVISGHELGDENFDTEITVSHAHEKGTIQSYFTVSKIKRLIQDLGFELKTLQLQIYRNMHIKGNSVEANHLLTTDIREHGRYFVLLERSDQS